MWYVQTSLYHNQHTLTHSHSLSFDLNCRYLRLRDSVDFSKFGMHRKTPPHNDDEEMLTQRLLFDGTVGWRADDHEWVVAVPQWCACVWTLWMWSMLECMGIDASAVRSFMVYIFLTIIFP